jgi:molybdopterin-guanine dinucleotide biosynthesis protein B
VIVSPQKLALIEQLDREMALSEIAALLSDIDIILAEGYKRAIRPRFRSRVGGRGEEGFLFNLSGDGTTAYECAASC